MQTKCEHPLSQLIIGLLKHPHYLSDSVHDHPTPSRRGKVNFPRVELWPAWTIIMDKTVPYLTSTLTLDFVLAVPVEAMVSWAHFPPSMLRRGKGQFAHEQTSGQIGRSFRGQDHLIPVPPAPPGPCPGRGLEGWAPSPLSKLRRGNANSIKSNLLASSE